MNKEDVISQINEAFDGVEQPQEITLHVAEAHDDYDYNNNHTHRKKDFFGRWQDVPWEHIRACQNALSYLEKVGMRFYLPAYMVWYIRNYEKEGEVFTDHALYSLDPHLNDEKLSQYHKDRFSLFDRVQLRACAQFVRFCAEDSDGNTDSNFAQKIYERYWRQYDEI
jgi:hypothetical protein